MIVFGSNFSGSTGVNRVEAVSSGAAAQGLALAAQSPGAPRDDNNFAASLRSAASLQPLGSSNQAFSQTGAGQTGAGSLGVLENLLSLADDWRSGQAQISALSETAPKQLQAYLQAQTLSHRLGLQVQLLSGSAQGLTQSLRQLSQAGGA